MTSTSTNQGNGIIDVLLSAAILALVISVLVASIANLSYSQINTQKRIRANQLAREAIEISHNLSTHNWSSFASLQGTYHPTLTHGYYLLATGSDQIDNYFTRSIHLSPASPSAYLTHQSDPIQVTVTISWPPSSNSQSIQLTTYLINQSLPGP